MYLSNIETSEQVPSQFAGIVFDKGFPIDALLREAASRLQGEGVRIAGVVQVKDSDEDGGRGNLRLQSLADDWELPILEERGSSSRGCRLDYSAITEVTNHIERTLSPDTQLLILNRFGRAEAEGRGFRSIFETCLQAGMPALCAVRSDYRADWEAFHGGFADDLSCDADAIVSWWHALRSTAAAM